MQPQLRALWAACNVRRFHTNDDLSHATDPVGGHSARMAVMAIALWPDCRKEVLVTILMHDLGEYRIGDIPSPAKRKHPGLKERLDSAEQAELFDMGVTLPNLTEEEQTFIKILDIVDACRWAMTRAPQVMERVDWRLLVNEVRRMADEPGCRARQAVLQLLEDWK